VGQPPQAAVAHIAPELASGIRNLSPRNLGQHCNWCGVRDHDQLTAYVVQQEKRAVARTYGYPNGIQERAFFRPLNR
jgi:hypothetical protein